MTNEPPFDAYDDEPTVAPGQPQRASAPHQFPYVINSRYRCLGLLGQGSSGAVYKAFDSQLLREVAIKFIHRHQHEERTRLLNEARVLAQLEHPHICKVFEVAEEGEAVYLVMSYINGPHLNQWREQFSQKQLVSMIADIAGALHTAHQRGIVHCDIKPSNIVLRQTKNAVQAVLVDFGIAHAHLSNASVSGAGTEHYMAPERIVEDSTGGNTLTPAIDIYALGATLRFILTGSHQGNLDQLDNDLKRIIEHCLADDANARYSDAYTLQQDLTAYLSLRPISLRHSPLYKTKRLWQRSRWFRGTSAVAIGLALTAIVGVNFYQNTMSQRQLEQLNISEQVVQREYQIESIYRSPRHMVNQDLQRLREDAERWYQQATTHSEWLAAAHFAAAGRIFYQLYDNERALTSLEQAWRLGDRSDRTATSYALTLNRYHFDAKRQARTLPSAESREAANLQAYETYAIPALQVLDQVERIQLPRDYIRAMRLYLANEPMQALSLLRQGNFPNWFYQRYELMLEISDELIQDVLDDYREGDYLALAEIHEHAFIELVKRVPSYMPAYVLRATTLFSLQVSRENQHQLYDDTANSWIDSIPELLDLMADIDDTHPEYLHSRGRYHTLLSYRYHLTDLPTGFHLSRGARFFEQGLSQSKQREWPAPRTTAIIRGALGHYTNYVNYMNNRGESAANLLARYQVILETLPEAFRGSDYYMNLGNAYAGQARFSNSYSERDYYFGLADEAYAESVKRAPNQLALRANYARVLNTWATGLPTEQAIAQRKRSMELIAPTLERLPENPAVQYNHGTIYMDQAADYRQAGDHQQAAEYFAVADKAFAKVNEVSPQLDIGRQVWADIYLYFNRYLEQPLDEYARVEKVLEILNLEAFDVEQSAMSFIREIILLQQRHEKSGDPGILNELEQLIMSTMLDTDGEVNSADIARTLIYMSLYAENEDKSRSWRDLARTFFVGENSEYSLFHTREVSGILMYRYAQKLDAQTEEEKNIARRELAEACEVSREMYHQGYLKHLFLEDTLQVWRTLNKHSGVSCSPREL